MTIERSVAAFLLGIPAAMAGTTDDGVPDARYVEYARAFAPYTARISGVGSDGRRSSATATLLDPHWAITAAHVVSGLDGVVVTSGTTARRAPRVVVHPDWVNDIYGTQDLALVRCDEPLPLAYYPALSDGDERVGQVVSIVGYGLHGKLTEGHTAHDGKLRAGTQTIERFERSIIVCHAQCGTSTLEFCISPGDSGGPLFANGKLAGVNSFTMAPKGSTLRSRQGEETAHTRVSLYREWITGVMEGAK
jgi:S1-C subfamily serine protease